LNVSGRNLILLKRVFSRRTMTPRAISVLLVNADSPFARVFQDSLLRARGINFMVVQKSTAEEALAVIKTDSSFDIVVTDYALPNSNGLEFCLQLNQLDRPIPVVMVSSTKDVKLAVEVMKLGVEDFLLKEELDEAHVPRILVNILDRVRVRNQRRAVDKRMNIAESRSQAIRELVVTVCHEFNNPLAAIKICSDLLQRSPRPGGEQELLGRFDDNFQKIESEVRRLRDINFEKIDFLKAPASG
jgi:FixJ family two-component response regulator